MNDEDRKYLIPQRLDDPPKFLWWDLDVAMLFMGSVILGILCNQTLTFTGIGVVAAMAYQKIKAGRSRAFGLHAIYWYMPISLGFRITPPSAVREFVG